MSSTKVDIQDNGVTKGVGWERRVIDAFRGSGMSSDPAMSTPLDPPATPGPGFGQAILFRDR
jgi:hypothetical protein